MKRDDITSPDFIKMLNKDVTNEESTTLEDISISFEVTKKVISKLGYRAAMGKNRLPVQAYKYGGDIVVEAINDIARTSIDIVEVLDILKIGCITQIWKGEDRGDPINCRPNP